MKPVASLGSIFDRAKYVDHGLVAWSTTSPHAAAFSLFGMKLFEGEVSSFRQVTDVDCNSSGQLAIIGLGSHGPQVAFASGKKVLAGAAQQQGGQRSDLVAVLALNNSGAVVAEKANRLVLFGRNEQGVHQRGALTFSSSPCIIQRGGNENLCIVGLTDGTVSVCCLSQSQIRIAGSFQLAGHAHIRSLAVVGGSNIWVHAKDELLCVHVSCTSNNLGDDFEAELSLTTFVSGEGNRVESISLSLADGEPALLLPNRRSSGIEVATPRADSIAFTVVEVEKSIEGRQPLVAVDHYSSPFPKATVVGMSAVGATHHYRLLVLNERGSRCIESLTVDLRASAMLDRTRGTLQQRIAWCTPSELPALREACESELATLVRGLPPQSARESHEALSAIGRLQATAFVFFQRETELVQDAISSEDSVSVQLNRKLRAAYLFVLTCRLLQRLGMFDRCQTQNLSGLFDIRRRKQDLLDKTLELRDYFYTTFHVDSRFCNPVEELSRWGNVTSIVEALTSQIPFSIDPDRTTLLSLVDRALQNSPELPEAVVVLVGYAAWMAEEKSLVQPAVDDWLQSIQARRSLAAWSATAFSADNGAVAAVDGVFALAGLDRENDVADVLLGPIMDAFCANSRFEEAFQLTPLVLSRDAIQDRSAMKLLLLVFLRQNTRLAVELYRRSLGNSWHTMATRALAHAAVVATAQAQEKDSLGPLSSGVELLEGLIQPNSAEEAILRDVLNAMSGDGADRLRIESLIMLHHYAEAKDLCRVFPIKGSADGQLLADFQARLQCLVDPQTRNGTSSVAPVGEMKHVSPSALNPKIIRSYEALGSDKRTHGQSGGNEGRSHNAHNHTRAQISVFDISLGGASGRGIGSAPSSVRRTNGVSPGPTPRPTAGSSGRSTYVNPNIDDHVFCDAVLPRSRKQCGNKLPCEFHTGQ